MVLDNSEKYKATGDDFLKSSAQVLEMVVLLKNESGQKNAQAQAIRAIDGIHKIYVKEAHSNWMKTGMYFDGSYLMDDITVCKRIMRNAKP